MRWRAIALVAAVVLPGANASTAPPKPPPARIPSPVAISRVRLDVARGRVLTTTDLMLPAGRQPFGDLDVHVAYGGPGVPLAVDAQLIETPSGFLSAPLASTGAKLTVVPSTHAPSHAAFCVGRCEMAGSLVHIPAAVLVERHKASGQATLRIREMRELGPPLANGTREVLVRLGAIRSRPLVLGTIEIASDEPIARTEARYCGVQLGEVPLFVSGGSEIGGAIAPPLSSRSAHDDLCVRFGPAALAAAVSSTAPRQWP